MIGAKLFELDRLFLHKATRSRLIAAEALARAQATADVTINPRSVVYDAYAAEVDQSLDELRDYLLGELHDIQPDILSIYGNGFSDLAPFVEDMPDFSEDWLYSSRSGASLADRFALRADQVKSEMRSVLAISDTEWVDRTLSDMFVGEAGSMSPVLPLFLFGRMVIWSEYGALKQTIGKELFKAAGVEFLYWRLGVGHHDHGGQEVCEVYAVHDGDGRYLVNEVPVYPHPNCQCYLEPVR